MRRNVLFLHFAILDFSFELILLVFEDKAADGLVPHGAHEDPSIGFLIESDIDSSAIIELEPSSALVGEGH